MTPEEQRQWEQRRRELDGYDLPKKKTNVVAIVLVVLGLFLAIVVILIGECMAHTHF